MNKYLIIFIFISYFANCQTYEMTQSPTYGTYSKPTYTIKRVKTDAERIKESSDDVVNSIRAAAQNRAIRQAAEIQANAQIEAAQSIIDNQNRIEEERLKKIEDERKRKEKIEEEKNPNSILNRFKKAKG